MIGDKEELIRRLQKENAKLRKLIYRDELTTLLNRRGFYNFVKPIFKEVKSNKEYFHKRKKISIKSLSLLFIDIDNFKPINDCYGHDVGDRAVCFIARAVKRLIRNIDVVSRWGGDEFLIALVGANASESKIVASKIIKYLSTHPFRLKNERFFLSISIGIASLKKEKRLNSLIKHADIAMYRAKRMKRINNSNYKAVVVYK